MARTPWLENLTPDELRLLLLEKHRANRQARLNVFRRTGRVIRLEPQPVAHRIAAPILTEQFPHNETQPTAPKRRTWYDTLLTLIETSAAIGIVLLAFFFFQTVSKANQEFSASLIQPTLTPTALVQVVVLPSGHTPPTSENGFTRPNDDEIPAHLRPLVQSVSNLPLPTASPDHAVRIQIPAIGVDAPIVQGDGWEQLKKGVGQHLGTPNPGQTGNLVLSAHNDVFGEIFRYLDQLEPGDEIILYTSQRSYIYTVQQSQLVEPTRVEVMAPTREPVVTLISCYPYRVDDQRIVITALLSEQR